MKEYRSTRKDDDPDWPPVYITNISDQKVCNPLGAWVNSQRQLLKLTQILMQNNKTVDQTLKERVENLDVEVGC